MLMFGFFYRYWPKTVDFTGDDIKVTSKCRGLDKVATIHLSKNQNKNNHEQYINWRAT